VDIADMKARQHVRAVMVWGTSSGAGKSLLATALCRWAARQGIDVAPFKAQNMSNNARVVPGVEGGFGEIGAAQYFQAMAARVVPSVDMNPVLLKPERDTASQVVLQGRVAARLSGLPWRERSTHLALAARESFGRLRAQHELIVMEGAGSPAEINLAAHDYVNLEAARWARDSGSLQCLLVTDIDRGGAFAHLFGTWQLLPADLRSSVAGFVLNKFRGDAGLLAPGPAQLQALTGVSTVAVLPLQRDHGLPEEDGLSDTANSDPGPGPSGGHTLHVVVVAYPHISNLDEFQALRQLPSVRLRWARSAVDLDGAQWIILPGSKQVSSDLAWLKVQGMARIIQEHAAAGRHVLGICGGLQMLGQTLHDPNGVDGEAGAPQTGLGLLALHTGYAAPKKVCAQTARFQGLAPPWQALSGVRVDGYEIRNGITAVEAAPSPRADAVLRVASGEPIGWQQGAVLGVYLHGLFESAAVVRSLFGQTAPTLDSSLDGLADMAEAGFGVQTLSMLLQQGRRR
jgi:adenosylcobyric acid synthase